jgi:hypothetical protein
MHDGGFWRIAADNRLPENPPSASAVRGIAAIRDRVIFRKVALKAEGVKNSNKPLWRNAFLRVS